MQVHRGFSCWLEEIPCLPFHSVRASNWWSRGWPSFPDPPLDHFRALDTKATRSGEFGSIKLNTLARFSANDTIRPLPKAHIRCHRSTKAQHSVKRLEKYCMCQTSLGCKSQTLSQLSPTTLPLYNFNRTPRSRSVECCWVSHMYCTGLGPPWAGLPTALLTMLM